MVNKYRCECGYIGKVDWVKKREKVDGGWIEGEGLGCPECKNFLSSGKAELIKEELDNE